MSQLVRTVLPSGVRVLVWSMPVIPFAAVQVSFGTGSRADPKEKAGVAHFLEHMAFKGGKELPAPKLVADALEEVSGEANAFTAEFMISFFIFLPARHLEQGFAVLSDMILNAQFPEGELEKERNVIREEIDEFASNPRDQVGEDFQLLVCGDQPAGWSSAGYHETVGRITCEDLTAFVADYYTGSNMVVSVAGGIDPGEVERFAQRYFPRGPSLRGRPKRMPRFRPSLRGAKMVAVREYQIDRTSMNLGVLGPRLGTRQSRTIGLAARILGGGMSSRLFQRVREELGLAYDIHAGFDPEPDYGMFVIGAQTNPRNVEKILREIVTQCECFAREGLTDQELARAKESAVVSQEKRLIHPMGAAAYFSDHELLLHRTTLPTDFAAKIAPITKEEVRATFANYFRPEELRLAIAGPALHSEQELEALLRFS